MRLKAVSEDALVKLEDQEASGSFSLQKGEWGRPGRDSHYVDNNLDANNNAEWNDNEGAPKEHIHVLH